MLSFVPTHAGQGTKIENIGLDSYSNVPRVQFTPPEELRQQRQDLIPVVHLSTELWGIEYGSDQRKGVRFPWRSNH